MPKVVPAVGRKHQPRDPARLFAEEERDRVRNVLSCPEAGHRHAAQVFVDGSFVPNEASREIGGDEARCDGVHADSVFSEVVGGAACEHV